jgi:outer membrane protein with beta-barrel domain
MKRSRPLMLIALHDVLRVGTAVLALLSFAAPVRADEPPGCPPGEWFCDDGSEPGPPDDGDANAATAPGPERAPEGNEWIAPPPSSAQGSTEAQSPPPAPIDESAWSEGSAGHLSPWSLALRAQGVVLESGGRGGGLGGVGASGRYILNPTVTFDLGVDTIVGSDYNGYDHSELSLSLSTLLYLNSHPIVRTYVLVGLNVSRASVEVQGEDQTWGYFGGQAGLGLEFALDPHIAVNFDVLGFVRGRTDSRAASEPEFTDEHGRVTNTSGGSLLRGGVTLRF